MRGRRPHRWWCLVVDHEWRLAAATYRVRRPFESAWRDRYVPVAGRRCARCGEAEVAVSLAVAGVGSTFVDAIRIVEPRCECDPPRRLSDTHRAGCPRATSDGRWAA